MNVSKIRSVGHGFCQGHYLLHIRPARFLGPASLLVSCPHPFRKNFSERGVGTRLFRCVLFDFVLCMHR